MVTDATRAATAEEAIALRYTTVMSGLGPMLVAATDAGVCAVVPAGDDAEALARLRAEFPHAGISRDDRALEADAAAVLARLDGDLTAPCPALDLRGTAFRRRVWDELLLIPAGETITYGELAARIGRPTATRAVANACGANRIAVLVPCHRVVGANGGLGGYKWGVERKRALLDRERSGR